MMTWAARHPHPGEQPEKPSDAQPQVAADYDEWWRARERWNSYVLAVRRHDLARYVDHSVAREEMSSMLTNTDIALRTIAMMILDGSVPSNFAAPHSIWKL